MRISIGIFLLAATLAAFVLAPRLAAQAPQVYAIENAKIYTLTGPPIENGTVLIRDGKIAAVGQKVDVPADAKVIDGKGLELYPGMFDPVTQMGLSEVGAVSATVDVAEIGNYNPDVVAAEAVNPASAHIPVTRASGITEAVDVPGVGGFDFFGGGGVIGGQASAIHLAGWTMDQMLIRKSVAMEITWPTMATRHFDFASFSFKDRPFTEVKQEYDKKIYELTGWVERARHYAQAEEKGSASNFARDLKLEALVPVVTGKLPVLVVASSARDIRNAVEFCDKQHLKMILAGGAEAWKVKDLLKQKNIPVILQPTLSLPEHEDDPYDKPYSQPGELAAAGVKIAFASFDSSFARRLPQDAGTAVAYGLPHDEALKAVTLYPAQIFGLDKELGTIEPGKIANIMVTTGDPLELTTEVRFLFIKGQLTSTDNKHRQLYEEYRKRP
jgi:imidazolonepropionase-like amidohydrolase